jgi:hypothetical protein
MIARIQRASRAGTQRPEISFAALVSVPKRPCPLAKDEN